jgi:cysteine sulfinate desulfinase/cysteine desulfurase-like protein
MGVAADETDRVVRFSSGWETTAEDWQALTKGVHTVGRELAG